MMSLDKFLFAKIILGDPELTMHYHIHTKSPDFHYEISSDLDHLQIGEKYAGVAPRGFAKTTLITLIHPLFGITFNEWWCRFLLMISESETQSELNLGTLGNEVEFNPKYKFFFGNRMGGKKVDKWGSLRKDFITKFHNDRPNDTARVQVRGVGQKVRGMKYGPYRPSAIADDFEGDGNSLTVGQRLKMRRWVNGVVIPACDRGIFAAVGTIIDDESYLNRIAGSEAWKKGKYIRKGWKIRFYQGVIQDTKVGEFIGEGKEIMENGVPKTLWEDYKPFEVLNAERERLRSEGDEQLWFQEIQNIPTTDSFRVFKMKDIRYWEGKYHEKDGIQFLDVFKDGEWKVIPINIFIGVDPASSERITADYSVVMVIGVAKDYDIYIIEYWREQSEPMRVADELWKRMIKYQPKGVNIEVTGHKMLEAYISKRSKSRGKFFAINPQEAYTNKIYRIMELQPMFGSHSIYFQEDMIDLENEYSRFRKDGKSKKDTMDALRWAIEGMFPPDLIEKAKEQFESTPSSTGGDWETGQTFYD